MIANYMPMPNFDQAPEIIRQLRAQFDDRLESLNEHAMRLIQENQPEQTIMVHVPFTFAGYEVEAMYDREMDLFTQLVARPLADRENARPSYTISLFLIGQQ